MAYVPVIPHHADPPSPRTRELADLLGRVIEEYEKHHPAVTGAEVRAAVRMAAQRSSRQGAFDVRILAGASAAVVVGGWFALLAANQGKVPETAAPIRVLDRHEPRRRAWRTERNSSWRRWGADASGASRRCTSG